MPGDKRVVLVDKETELTEIAQEAAGLASWELTVATDTAQALELVAGEQPAVIILGYLEPQGEAFRLHKQLRENPETENTPQVVVNVAPVSNYKRDGVRPMV